jgi:hypothetical protein
MKYHTILIVIYTSEYHHINMQFAFINKGFEIYAKDTISILGGNTS